MKALRIAGIVLVLYVGIVVAFESWLGSAQPSGASTLVITTFDANAAPRERVLSRIESGGQLYVAANHWPRAWYRRALEKPEVQVKMDGKNGDYRAVPVSGDEHDRVNTDRPLGVIFRILTGFPPRYFLRLESRQGTDAMAS